VLAFEDMQWADSSLLDFIEYLLEWSRDFPLYVVTLGRPELQERRPGWGAGQRSFTSVYLESLPESAMQELLDGLAPGLPEALRKQILARAEGVPLYAMETVRMLLDRGLLEREGDLYQPTGEIAKLDVPETLHALVAARLDGLSQDERRSVQDAAVLGKTFTRQALSAVSGLGDPELEPLLVSLVRKEILGVHADPRSPERGQYGFLQDLVRRVAYETLSKKERKLRHLSAARFLEKSWAAGEQEIVEVIAAHFLAAYEALPDAEDAAEIRRQAHEQLAQAGERAASLGALTEAEHYFEQAAELAVDVLERARLLERAGTTALENAEFEPAERRFSTSLELFEAEGDARAAARVAGRLGYVEYMRGRGAEAIERLERTYATIAKDQPDESLAMLAMLLARVYLMTGNFDAAEAPAELALELGESLRLPEVLCSALGTKGAVAGWRGSFEQPSALGQHVLRLAIELDVPDQELRARINLSDLLFRRDRYDEALEHLDELLAVARRTGRRRHELMALGESTYPLYMRGRWDEAVAAFDLLPEDQLRTNPDLTTPLQAILEIHLHRGNLDAARALLDVYEHVTQTDDTQNLTMYAAARAAVLRAEGKLDEALAAGSEAANTAATLTAAFQGVKQGLVEAAEAALSLGEPARALELLAIVEQLLPGRRPPYLEAHAHRIRARIDDDEAQFGLAEQIFREYGITFWLGVTQLEHAEWLAARRDPHEAETLVGEARETFAGLEAIPWLERAERLGTQVAA
jgi:tetratricopeptide (TPR) repeat protein